MYIYATRLVPERKKVQFEAFSIIKKKKRRTKGRKQKVESGGLKVDCSGLKLTSLDIKPSKFFSRMTSKYDKDVQVKHQAE